MVVYHGTTNEFTVFDRGKTKRGFYFAPPTRKYSVAGYYGKGKEKAFFLNAKNPIETTPNNKSVNNKLPKDNDGLVIRSDKDFSAKYFNYSTNKLEQEDLKKGDIVEIIVPSPNQIKSATDNVGTFSSEEDDIRFRERFIDGINQYEIIDKLDELSSWTNGFYNLTTALEDYLTTALEDYFKGEIVSASNGAKHALERGLVPVPAHKYAGLNEEYHHIEFRDENGETFVEAVPFVNAEDVEENFGIRYRNQDVASRIEELFNQAIAGDFKGKPTSIGKLTAEGKAYLESLSGLKLKDDVDFVLNASDLVHIYNNHFGNNEKDKGNNIPLTIHDIKRMVDVISFPTEIVYTKNKNGRNAFYFLMESQNGTYNLMEVYADRKGNLTAKTYYKTKKGVSQRAMSIKNNSLHSTSATGGATFSSAKIPQIFENPSIFENISERQGGKTYTDEELSYENDPIAKVLGKPRYSLPQTKAFAKRQRERMLNHADIYDVQETIL